ncbi:MAG: hypothetical protein ACXWDM_08685, partial [Nocardioides sp.]
ASVGDTLVADTRAPVVVWEPRRVVPSYAVPVADVRAELVPAPPSEDHDQLLLDWDTGHRSPPRPVRPHRLPAQQPVTPW